MYIFLTLIASVRAEECRKDGSDASMMIEVSDQKTRQLSFTNCPMYDWTTQTTPNSAEKQSTTVQLPTQVDLCETPISIGLGSEQPDMGAIGVALEGVLMYTPVDAEFVSADSSAKGRDAVIFEGNSVGDCGSHATPHGALHYHAHPGIDPKEKGGCAIKCDRKDAYGCNRMGTLCDEKISSSADVCEEFKNGSSAWYTDKIQKKTNLNIFNDQDTGKHSLLLGFVRDGIPIYGFLGSDGTEPNDLDECNGHDSDLGFYHYHATRSYPYLIGCYRGIPHSMGGRESKKDQSCKKTKSEDYSKILPNWTYGNSTSFKADACNFNWIVVITFFLALL